MGLLNGTSVYLIGSVDHHKDPRKWRRDIAHGLLRPLGVKVYDPIIKPDWFNKNYPLDGPLADFHQFKHVLNYGPDTKINTAPAEKRMWAVRDLCLRMAHDCNFIIASLPKKFTVGTLEEFGVAVQSKKPILLYLPDGMDTSTWLPAQMSMNLNKFFQNSFSTMQELCTRVLDIDSGSVKVDSLEWIFLSYFNDEAIKNEFPDH